MALWIVDVKRFYVFFKNSCHVLQFLMLKNYRFYKKMLVQIVRIQLKKYFNDILYRLLR